MKPRLHFLAFALLLAPAAALAQTDEIQVYDANIAEVGVFNLMLHNNFTPSGVKTPAFPGALINDRNYNGVAEWAYGVTEWFEAGLYLPLYSVSARRGPSINGGKIRFLFVRPHADDHKFFFGSNFEFSYNAKHWEDRTFTSEIRPIVGVHLKPVDIVFNPILDNNWYGGFRNLDFAPCLRVAYNINDKWTVAGEQYADFGHIKNFDPLKEQYHQSWAVVDHPMGQFEIETGIGFGLTGASDNVTIKFMISRDLNSKKKN